MWKPTLLILSLVLLGVPTGISAQEVTMRETFGQSGISRTTDARNFLTTFSRITWYFLLDPPTECLFKIEQSSYGITWTDLTSPQDCTSEGKTEFITPTINRVLRFNVTAFTHPSAGSVTLAWQGFTGQKCGKEYDGIFSTIVSPDPVAGAELSIVVPALERWRVYSSSFHLQTDGTNEDRNVFLTVSDNGSEYFRTFADGVVKANQEGIFTAAPLGFVGTTGLGPSSIHQPVDVRTIMIPVYSAAFVPSGHTLATDTDGMQSGDDYSSAVVLVERCPS